MMREISERGCGILLVQKNSQQAKPADYFLDFENHQLHPPISARKTDSFSAVKPGSKMIAEPAEKVTLAFICMVAVPTIVCPAEML
jgi:hypothetical protein